MLTAELVRATVRRGAIRPQYVHVDAGLLETAEALCEMWCRHLGCRREELDEALDDLVGDETHFAIVRGLARLLDDRSTWETVAPCPPEDLRRAVFEAAAEARPVRTLPSLVGTSRDVVLERAAASLGITVEVVERALYADLKAEQVLTSHESISARALLDRYNVALAQGVLLRARELRLTLSVDRPSKLRAFYRALKFHQLMHRSERVEGGWRVTIDGPLSLFEQSSRYGLQMALLLTSILHLEDWQLEADVDWRGDGKLARLEVSPGDGLVATGHARGTWVTDEETELRRRLVEAHERGRSPWKIVDEAEVLDLGGADVLVPDFSLRDDRGREAHVELIGFWRRSYLERRAEALGRHGPPNLVLCVSKRLATASEVPAAAGIAVVPFAAVIPLAGFLEAVDRVAKGP
ncbi:MAG: DUF790 family protein [Myxococcales bacterium]|nr:DUF790 family protein [Myxococcales bacterium]